VLVQCSRETLTSCVHAAALLQNHDTFALPYAASVDMCRTQMQAKQLG
jgi:hypothetical protein